MMLRDPRGIKCLCTARDGRSIRTHDSDLITWINPLAPARGRFCALASLPTTTPLREEGADPGLIDEITGAAETGKEYQVEEDTVVWNG